MYDPSSASPSPHHKAPTGPSQWSPSTAFRPGNIVWFAGTFWRCEVGHTSASGMGGAPPNTLHLWTPVSSNGYLPQQTTQYPFPNGPHSNTNLNIISPTPRHMPSKPPAPSLEKLHQKSSNDSSSSSETVTGPSGKGGSGMNFFTARAGESMRLHLMKEEGERSRNKEELEQELLGKRIWRVGGIGAWAYSLDPEEEKQKREFWKGWSRSHGKDDWLAAARARTAHYNGDSRSTKPLIQWKLVEKNASIPPEALAIGHEADGQLLYAVRAWFNGGIHLGKAASRASHNASISWGGVEHLVDTYEVLCGAPDPTLLKWMTFRHGERCDVHGWLPVEGGREAAGEALLIAKGSYENGQHPGKCLIHDDHACIGWGGGEVWVRPFEVLAYSTADRR